VKTLSMGGTSWENYSSGGQKFRSFSQMWKSVVAQGACPIQGARNQDLGVAGVAEEITHAVEDIFPLMEWISGVRGVDFSPLAVGGGDFWLILNIYYYLKATGKSTPRGPMGKVKPIGF
jgi:hypothetical protein